MYGVIVTYFLLLPYISELWPPPLVGDLDFKLSYVIMKFMGRIVPSYRIAAEREKSKWKSFRQALDKSERKIFDEMFSYSKLYNVAGSNACRPVLIHPILMSIIFEHHKQITQLEAAIKK